MGGGCGGDISSITLPLRVPLDSDNILIGHVVLAVWYPRDTVTIVTAIELKPRRPRGIQ